MVYDLICNCKGGKTQHISNCTHTSSSFLRAGALCAGDTKKSWLSSFRGFYTKIADNKKSWIASSFPKQINTAAFDFFLKSLNWHCVSSVLIRQRHTPVFAPLDLIQDARFLNIHCPRFTPHSHSSVTCSTRQSSCYHDPTFSPIWKADGPFHKESLFVHGSIFRGSKVNN